LFACEVLGIWIWEDASGRMHQGGNRCMWEDASGRMRLGEEKASGKRHLGGGSWDDASGRKHLGECIWYILGEGMCEYASGRHVG
jgi:hypothetical protein